MTRITTPPRHVRLTAGAAVAGGLVAALLVAPTASAAPGDPDLLVAELQGPVQLVPNDGTAPTPQYDDSAQSTAVFATPAGDAYVAEDGGRVVRYPADGEPADVITRGGPEVFGIAVAPDGTVYLGRADGGGRQAGIDRLAPGGEVTQLAAGTDVFGVAIAADGTVYGATGDDDADPEGDPGAGLVAVAPDGTVARQATDLGFVADVAVADSDAGQDTLLLTDNDGGTVSSVAGFGSAPEPVADVPGAFGVAAEADGDVYVTSDSGDAVVKIPAGTGVAEPYNDLVVNPVDVQVVVPVPDPVPSTTELRVTQARLTADVSGGEGATTAPTGEVAFEVDGEPVGTAPLADLDGSPGTARAVLEYRTPVVDGPTTITATYAGDAAYTGSSDDYVRTNPTITSALSSQAPESRFGWYRTPVTVTYACEAGSGPLTFCPGPATRSRNGGFIVVGEARSSDGGRATVRDTFRIDRVQPDLVVGGRNGGPYPPRARPLRCRATDDLSGVDSCEITYTRADGGDRIRWRAVAKDRAGNSRVKIGSYRTT